MRISYKEIIKESRVLSEGRKEDAQEKYDGVPVEIYDLIVELDPSGNHKYIDWIMNKWWSEKCEGHTAGDYRYRHYCMSKNGIKELMNDISFFHGSPHKYDIKDINSYTHIYSFNEATKEARIKLTKGELKKQAIKLWETDRHLIVEPTSHASSCYYGAGTQWCTTMRGTDSYFKQYTDGNSLFYYINKRTGKKRAFLTPVNVPMFGPRSYGATDWAHAGEKEFQNFHGQIYTETDNLGRSFRGIPEEGRVAMQNRHIEKAKKHATSLGNSEEKVGLMRGLGMDDIPVLTTIRSWNGEQGDIDPNITKINQTFLVNKNGRFGNVVSTHNLDLRDSVTEVSGLETVVQKLTINTTNSVSLGSLSGEINVVRINSGGISDFGNITKIDELVIAGGVIPNLSSVEIRDVRVGLDMASKIVKDKLGDFSDNVRVDRWL